MRISNFYENRIEPPYDYKIYDNRIEIHIELIGEISKFHAKTIQISGEYVFIYTGNIKFPKDETKMYDNITDGEFRLQINIPITFGTITDVHPKYDKDKRNGVITLIYYYCTNNKDEGMIDL